MKTFINLLIDWMAEFTKVAAILIALFMLIGIVSKAGHGPENFQQHHLEDNS